MNVAFSPRCYAVGVLSFLLIFLVSTQALASDVAVQKSTPSVRIVTENYPPYQFSTNDGSISGVRTEFVKAVLMDSKLSHQLSVLPWARAYKTTLETPNTCLFSVIYNKERDDKFIWVDSIGEVQGGFFTTELRRKTLELTTLNDLHKYTIAVPRDGISQLILEIKGFSTERELVLVNDWQTAIDMVVKGRVDLMVTNELVISYQLEQLNQPKKALKKVFTIKEFKSNHHYLACNKQTDAEIIQRLRQSISKLKDTNLQQLLREKWLN